MSFKRLSISVLLFLEYHGSIGTGNQQFRSCRHQRLFRMFMEETEGRFTDRTKSFMPRQKLLRSWFILCNHFLYRKSPAPFSLPFTSLPSFRLHHEVAPSSSHIWSLLDLSQECRKKRGVRKGGRRRERY